MTIRSLSGGRQRLVREDARVRVAHPERDDAAGDVRRAVVDQPGQRGGEQVDLDVLALAGGVAVPQRGEDADHGVVAGHHVEHRDAGPVRRAVRVAGEAHQPGDRLHHEVVAGHVACRRRQPKPLIERVDDAAGWPPRRTRSRGRTCARPPGLKFSISDVRAAGQLARQRGVGVVAQVERDRPLAAVDAEEVGRRRRRGPAGSSERVSSPRGPSTLTTSAPRSASSIVAYGPGEDPREVGDEQTVRAARRGRPRVRRRPPGARDACSLGHLCAHSCRHADSRPSLGPASLGPLVRQCQAPGTALASTTAPGLDTAPGAVDRGRAVRGRTSAAADRHERRSHGVEPGDEPVPRRAARSLLRGGTVLTMDDSTPVLTGADVLVVGDRIAEVGHGSGRPRTARRRSTRRAAS